MLFVVKQHHFLKVDGILLCDGLDNSRRIEEVITIVFPERDVIIEEKL
jgi:hypothetical protein